MPGDTLVIFGTEYNNVAGIQAYDSNDQLQTYIKPSGTINITSNGTGVDVSNYASADITVQSQPLKIGVLRPDAELVQTWSRSASLVSDDNVTIPSYSTSATTLLSSAALSPTYTVSTPTYRYCILERMIVHPEYSVSTKGKGKIQYQIVSRVYQHIRISDGKFKVGNVIFNATTGTMVETGNYDRQLYWTSSSAMNTYSANTYGLYFTPVAPTIDGTTQTITVSSPTLKIRGNSSYMSNTYYNALTDIKYQYIIELYRIAQANTTILGWTAGSQAEHVLDCINNNNFVLT